MLLFARHLHGLFVFSGVNVYSSFTLLLGSENGSLNLAGRYLCEGGILDKVLQLLGRLKHKVYGLDVAGGELLHALRTYARKRDAELAKPVNNHLVTSHEHLAQAAYQVCGHALHGTLREYAVVLADVVDEFLGRNYLVELHPCKRFPRLLGVRRVP